MDFEWDMKTIWNDIIGGVGSTPTMVFSVIGDSDRNVSRPWPTSVFKTALIEAALSGGKTWILYHGNEKGVSKVVRDAYKNYEDLNLNVKRSEIANDIRKIKLISLQKKKKENQPSSKLPTQYNTEIDIDNQNLVDFERLVSKQHFSIGMPVPIAIFVCGGDIQTIDHIYTALTHGLPVIIMKGSGMAADLVADSINNSNDHFKKASFQLGCIGDSESTSDILDRYLSLIYGKKNGVFVFDLNHDDPLMLSNIVGEAVVNCWSSAKVDKLDFASKKESKTMHCKGYTLLFKRNLSLTTLLEGYGHSNNATEEFIAQFKEVNDPTPYVLNPTYITPTSPPLYYFYGYYRYQQGPELNNKIGEVLLLEALKANRVDYVRNLLDQGVILDNAYLGDLYKSQISEDLTEMHLHERKLPRAAEELCRKCIQYSECPSTTKSEDESNSNVLLWAILADRKEIAELCWFRGNELLLTGLVCSVLLEKRSEEVNNVKQQVLKSSLEDHSKLFEKRCIGLMDRMYEENTKYAYDLMVTETEVWGIHCSPLVFAYENGMLNVLAHACSQNILTRVWSNFLNPETLPSLRAAFTRPRQFFTAPRTKYVVHYLLFFLMLVMYSVFVLTSVSTEYYNQNNARVYEYYVYFWVAGDIVEEVITCLGVLPIQHRSKKNVCTRLKMHFNNFWNLLDLLSYVLIILAFLFRHFYDDTTFTVARRMFALSLLIMYLRFLEAFLISKKLGPTLIMIKEMLEDLSSFLFIAVFLLFGVGIYYHANIWPDDQTILSGDSTEWKIWTILYYPYWQLFAELNMNYLEGSEQPNCNKSETLVNTNYSMSRCPQEDWTVPVVAAVYLLLSNLLLINLVIAKFSYTFEKVQENSEKLWAFEFYTAAIDYSWRIPSPFNLFFLPFRFFRFRGFCKNAEVSARREIMENQRDFQKVLAVRIYNKF